MNIKSFDFKDFMLRFGQYVAVGIGVLVLAPLVYSGFSKIISSGRASVNAKELSDRAGRAQQAINNSPVPPDADKPPVEFLVTINFTQVDPKIGATEMPYFVTSGIEDTKRRNPDVLPASDSQATVVLGGVQSYLMHNNGNKLQIMVIESTKPVNYGKNSRIAKRLDRIAKQYGLTTAQLTAVLSGGGRAAQGRGVPGGGRMDMDVVSEGGKMPNRPGSFIPGRMPGAGPAPGEVVRTRYEDIEKAETKKLAENVQPVRMVVVNAAFPFRKQLEEFRSKLRRHSLSELFALMNSGEAPWEFRGLEIQRRTFSPDGKPKTEWKDYTKELSDSYRQLLIKAVDAEPEEENLLQFPGIINRGLVQARPMLSKESHYPPMDLPSITESISNLAKMFKPDSKRLPTAFTNKFHGVGIDAFDPISPFGTGEETAETAKADVAPVAQVIGQGGTKPKEGDQAPVEDPDANLLVPDKALVRFIDINVEPGMGYEYRFKVKMANPNFKQDKAVAYASLAKPEELVASDWTMVPKVEVPYESYWYVTDERAETDKVTLQLQRWVYDTMIVPDGEPQPVADWTILDKAGTHRGEYIGHIANVEVPIWSIEKEKYEMAHVPRSRASNHRIPIDFTVREVGCRYPALLMDFSGGKGTVTRAGTRTVRDDLPVSLLVFTPDGKLVLRSSAEDVEDKARQDRFDDWKTWLVKVKTGRTGNAQQPQMNMIPGVGGIGTRN